MSQLKLKPWIVVLLVALLAGPVFIVGARADCSDETQTHLSMVIDFYKEWETYSGESADTSEGLAKAEWDNFAHEMDWINDHGDMPECEDRKINLVYYLYRAKKDMRDAIYAADSTDLLAATLQVYYDDVNVLYDYGYARVNPTYYAFLKQDVKSWFAKARLPFTSWEKPAIPKQGKSRNVSPSSTPEPDKRIMTDYCKEHPDDPVCGPTPMPTST